MSTDNIKKAIKIIADLTLIKGSCQHSHVLDLLDETPEAEGAPQIPDGYEIVTEGKIQEGDIFRDSNNILVDAVYTVGEDVTDHISVYRKTQPEPVIGDVWEHQSPDRKRFIMLSGVSDDCAILTNKYRTKRVSLNTLFSEYKHITNVDISLLARPETQI